MAGLLEYGNYDALGLAELVRRREVSGSELVEEAIARIGRVNSELNAIIRPLYERARAAAREMPSGDAPLAGVPFLLKDLLQKLRGEPTEEGSRFYRGHVSDYDTELALRYQRAGLVFIAKTNTPELGILPVTEPEAFGPTRNPWALDRTPGGSSGGSAAAVAARVVPMAHGGDGGGSIRIPASCCGLFGLKPSRGRNPLGPKEGELWNGFVQEHVISRSVRDSAAALDATQGPEPTSPYHAPPKERPFLDETSRPPGRLRIAFHAEPAMGGTVHADCLHAVRDAARLCEELGHHVEEVKPDHPSEELARSFFTVIAANAYVDLVEAERRVGRRPTPRDFESSTWLTAQIGRRLSATDLALALYDLQKESRRLVRFYRDYDVVLTPTLAVPPVRVGELKASGLEKKLHDVVARGRLNVLLGLPGVVEATVSSIFAFVPFTPVANFTGQPSMSVPLSWNDDGLPIGTLFTARYGDEATLFRLAAQLEQARPWFERRPPVHGDT